MKKYRKKYFWNVPFEKDDVKIQVLQGSLGFRTYVDFVTFVSKLFAPYSLRNSIAIVLIPTCHDKTSRWRFSRAMLLELIVMDELCFQVTHFFSAL